MERGQKTDQKFEWTPSEFLRCRSRVQGEPPSKTTTSSAPRSVAHGTIRSDECESKNASEPLRIEQKGSIEVIKGPLRHSPKRYGEKSRGKKVRGPQ